MREALFAAAALVAACSGGGVTPTPTPTVAMDSTPTQGPTPTEAPMADVYVEHLGDAIPGLDAATVALFERGREVMVKAFTVDEGLGPTFNTDSCAGCHQFPAVGGASPRYRDFFLVYQTRDDGALMPVGTNGTSPVRNLYAVPPAFHIPEPAEGVTYARRNIPPGFGVGLFTFIDDAAILAHADADDADGDGISGRPNYEQGRVGRFGFKSQAFSLESFNRGAALNQMGLTTNPLFYTFPEAPVGQGALRVMEAPIPLWQWLLRLPSQWNPLASAVAHAQVGAPDEPVFDDDAAADPEMSDDDQRALLIFSTYLGAPRPGPMEGDAAAGKALFTEAGCAACHVPTLPSKLGALALYSDLLIHNMGEALADGAQMGVAKGDEFRTQPLWGVSTTGPYLHDGSAQTLTEAILAHGGEAQASRDAFVALGGDEQGQMMAFLAALGGSDHEALGLDRFEETVPGVNEPGGPDQALDEEGMERWLRGRDLFNHDAAPAAGLGEGFNADSCRACHQDPVIGGAGGLDTNVLRVGRRDESGAYEDVATRVLPRSIVPGQAPVRLPEGANVVEGRNPPSLMGAGLLDRIPEAAILAGADADDLDGDGISGRARVLGDGRLGRFGLKAQVPSVADFAADALLGELGLTVDPALSDFTAVDDGDGHPDPELAAADYDDLAFYISHIAPARPTPTTGDAALEAGQALFAQVGCDACHLPTLGGVKAYTDLLLHEVYDEVSGMVEQDDGVDAGEYRTPPLWGVIDTPPYLHDGRAQSLDDAVRLGHGGEAAGARLAYEALSEEERAALLRFVETR